LLDVARRGTLPAMVQDLTQRTHALIDRLRQDGHHAEADHLAHQLSLHAVEAGLLFALRETCETLLTAIEAIDPVTQTLIEELRLEVEARLRPSDDHRSRA
jgi:hypothetical protein